MTEIVPIIEVTANGLTQLQQLGLAGVLGSFLLISLGLAIWHCERRTKENQQAYREDALANREVLTGVKDALTDMRIAIVEIKAKQDK